MKAVAQVTSKALLMIGGLIFFFGDRALRDFWKVNFANSLLAIPCGIGVLCVGAAIQTSLSKSERKEGGTPGT